MKKVILFMAEGFEEIEAISVVDILRRGGVECYICSVKGEYITGSHNITIKGDNTIDDVDFRSYDGIIIPGGMQGAENLRGNVRVIELVKDFYMSGKLVAAICAAPIVFAEAGIVDGRKITSHPIVINRLKNCIYTEKPVEVDGNIITSRGPATSLLFGLKILEYLGYSEEAHKLSEGMLVNYMNNIV